MYLPISIIIPNIGPPTLNVPPKDVSLQVGEFYQLKFSGMSDPDWEDTPFLVYISFGEAQDFITGTYPNFILKPTDNSTHPGTYTVNMEISDNNPNL